jgi:hypothetical protein
LSSLLVVLAGAGAIATCANPNKIRATVFIAMIMSAAL